MKAVIMAGGFGTRLRPLTCNIPKPMVPVANAPILEHIVKLLKNHGITDLICILYFQPEIIQDYFEDGSDFGVSISYITAQEDLGTAGCVKNAEEMLDDTFLVMSGDVLTDFNLTDIINFHKEKRAIATMTLTRVQNPLEYGVVIVDKEEKIERFLEKPTWGEVFSDTVNAGVYVLDMDALKFVPKNKEFDFSKNLFPLLLADTDNLFGHVAGGYWRDIGDLTEYRLSHYDIFSGEMELDIPGQRISRIGKDVWLGKDSRISKTANLKGAVIIGNNVDVKDNAYIENSVIGDNCVISEGAFISKTIVWENVFIGKEAKIRESTICKRVDIRENAFISEGAVISDDCVVGKGATIKAGVKMWPHKTVEDGATLSTSLVWGDKWSKKLFGAYGITGITNVEIVPEFASKLGASYGAMLGKGSTVLTSRDCHRSSRMINRAIICGLLSAGVNVGDLRTTPISVIRHELATSAYKGGFHVRRSPYDIDLMDIKIFDLNGSDLPSGKEKNIERLFFREDFTRAQYDEIGELNFPARVLERYSESFMSFIDLVPIKKAHFKVIIDYAFGSATTVFPSIIGQFGTELISLNAYEDENKITKSVQEFHSSRQQLSNIVKTLQANLGVMFDAGAEKCFLVDDLGRIIEGDFALSALTDLVLRTTDSGDIAVPVTASMTIETMASKYNRKVIRTKTSNKGITEASLMGNMAFVGEIKGGYIFPEFSSTFDAMFATGKIVEMLAKTGLKLSEIVDSVLSINMVREHIACSWEQKGKIMRNLIEDSNGRDVELIDGIKMNFGDAWVIVIPDSDRPVFHVNAEAGTKEKAKELTNIYITKIKSWQD